MNNSKEMRRSNIELLRIVAMLLIISFHYVYKSGYTFDVLNFNSFIVKTFYLFGELGVNIFFLITGYFMVDGKFSLKRLIKILLEVQFYNLLMVLVASLLGLYKFKRIKDIFFLLFPITIGKFWFVTVYVYIYILAPYLNILINNMKKDEHKRLIIIALIICSIIPTLLGVFYNSSEAFPYFSRFIWGVVLYLVGSYIKRYKLSFFEKKKNSIISALTSFSLMLLAIIVIYHFRGFLSKMGLKELSYFWTPNSILMVILSLSLFYLFLKIDIKPNKFINKIASTTLGVYILHDGYFDYYIWQNVFHSATHLDSNFSIFYILISAFIVFTIACLIDLIRQMLDKCLNKIIHHNKLA